MSIKVTLQDKTTYYRVTVSKGWFEGHGYNRLLTGIAVVGRDIDRWALKHFIRKGQAVEITKEMAERLTLRSLEVAEVPKVKYKAKKTYKASVPRTAVAIKTTLLARIRAEAKLRHTTIRSLIEGWLMEALGVVETAREMTEWIKKEKV